MEKAIIVPWDFTERASASFLHAKILSKINERPITLLHIVKKSSQIEKMTNELEEVAKKLTTEHNINVHFHCMAGNLFKAIKQYSSSIHTPVVVMPFHNSKRAYKVISGSEVPFYLVRDFPKNDSINDIVVPIDHYEKNRVQLNWVIFLSKFFNSNVNIIKPFINNNSKNRLMKQNIFFAKQIMESKEVEYGVRTAKREMKFTEAIDTFTQEIDADLIFMMSYNLKDYMKVSDKSNTTVPVMCLNPKSVKIVPDKY